MTAEESLNHGLVDRVVPEAELAAATSMLVEGIAGQAPLTLRAAKHAVETAIADGAGKDLTACTALERACSESKDYVEGRRAFAEKRAPKFDGR